MECEEPTTNLLLETIRKELNSIIDEDGLENDSEKLEIDVNTRKFKEKEHSSNEIIDSNEICTPSISCRKGRSSTTISDNTSRSSILDFSNICNIDDDIQRMQYNLNESCKLFQSIGERFENINFGCLKNRIKDLHLNDRSSDSIKIIVNDLKHSFDEKYMENRLSDLTKEVKSKFRNHPGEFGDIPEISEFFRTCTKLEQGMENLCKLRGDCLYLQKRMTRVAEASYERAKDIQQNIIKEDANI